MTTKNCANIPKLVLKDLCKKSFVRNDRLPHDHIITIIMIFVIICIVNMSILLYNVSLVLVYLMCPFK